MALILAVNLQPEFFVEGLACELDPTIAANNDGLPFSSKGGDRCNGDERKIAKFGITSLFHFIEFRKVELLVVFYAHRFRHLRSGHVFERSPCSVIRIIACGEVDSVVPEGLWIFYLLQYFKTLAQIACLTLNKVAKNPQYGSFRFRVRLEHVSYKPVRVDYGVGIKENERNSVALTQLVRKSKLFENFDPFLSEVNSNPLELTSTHVPVIEVEERCMSLGHPRPRS